MAAPENDNGPKHNREFPWSFGEVLVELLLHGHRRWGCGQTPLYSLLFPRNQHPWVRSRPSLEWWHHLLFLWRPAMGRKLYVGNLTYAVTASDLEQLFGQYGTVESAQVIADRDTGQSKGFAFVEMKT